MFTAAKWVGISYWKLVVIVETETIVLIDGSLDAGVVHHFDAHGKLAVRRQQPSITAHVDITSLSLVEISPLKKKNQTTFWQLRLLSKYFYLALGQHIKLEKGRLYLTALMEFDSRI